jgi:hypothetical protein
MFTFSPIAQRLDLLTEYVRTTVRDGEPLKDDPSSASASPSWPPSRGGPGARPQVRLRVGKGGAAPTAEASEYKLYATELSKRWPTPPWTSPAREPAAGQDRRRPMAGRSESTYRYTVIDTIGGGARRSRRTSSPGASSACRRTSECPSPRSAVPLRPRARSERGHRPRPLDRRSGGALHAPPGRLRRQVVKVGPVPGRGPTPTEPRSSPTAATGHKRVLLDLRTTTGARPFWPWPPRPTWWSRASVPAWSTGSASATRTCPAATRASSTARPAATARTAPRSRGPATTQLPGRGGYLAMSTPGRRRRTAASRRHDRRRRRRGHAGRPGHHGRAGSAVGLTGEGTYLDVSVADGVLWLMSLAVDEHLATGTSPGPGHDVLSGRYACYGTYQAAPTDGGWPWAPSRPSSSPTCAGPSAATSGSSTSTTTRPRTRSGRLGAAFATSRPRHLGGRAGRRRHLRRPGARAAEVADDPQFVVPGAVRRGRASDGRDGSAGGAVLAGMPPCPRGAGRAARHDVTDTETSSRRPRRRETSVAAWVARGGGMTSTDRRLAEARELIGEEQYPEGGVPRRARLHLDLVRVGGERQPALLGRRGGRPPSRRARSPRRPWSRSGSGPTTGPRGAPRRPCRCRSTST